MSIYQHTKLTKQHSESLWSSIAILCVAIACLLLAAVDARQTVAIPPLTYVNKNRTWKKDTVNLTTFRPGINLTKYFSGGNNTHIPRWATPIIQPKLAMHSTVVVPSTGFVVAFGGMMERDDLPNQPFELGTNKMYVYDPVTTTWFTEPTYTTAVPPRRLDHASWTFGDFVYVHGGEDSIVRSDTWRYYNRTWRLQSWAIPDRTGHSINTITMRDGTQVAFVFGGRDEAGVFHNKLFNITLEGVVKQVVPKAGELPIPRAYHASSVMYSPTKGPILLIHGGYDGNTPLRDLFGYYVWSNQWVRINTMGSGTTTQFDGSFTLGISIPTVMRHRCVALWPTMFCVGGKSTGDPITFEFDIVLNRYIEQFFTNPLTLAPLQGHTMVASVNTSNITEVLVIGGYTNTPKQFTTPITIFATTLQYDACPFPYINPDWVGTCVVCPKGSGFNTTINPHRCFPCPMGTFGDYSRCERCPKGTYNPRNASSNATSCIPCPAGSFTRFDGSWARSQCISCPNGTYADNGYCVDCPSGTVGVKGGAMYMDDGCKPCPYGSYADRGATSCITCPPGTSGPSFVRSLDPFAVIADGVAALQAGTSACTTGAAPASVDNTNYLRVVVSVRDWGENGTTRLNGYPRLNTATLLPTVTLYAYFNGPGVMHYSCQTGAANFNPTCASVAPNVTTPAISAQPYGSACQFQYFFDVRFMTPSAATKLYIKGDGLRGLEYTFAVVNKYNQITIGQWPTAVVVGQPFPLTVRAILNNVLMPLSNFTTQIRVQCLFTDPTSPPGSAATAPTYTVAQNGITSAPANLQSIIVVNSTATFKIQMVQTAGLCTIYNKHDYGDVMPNSYTGFTVQRIYSMYARLLTHNTSNWGIIRVEVTMVDHKANIVTGDSSSRVMLQMWPGATAVLENGPEIQQMQNGVTIFTVRVHSNNINKYISFGRFRVSHLSGLPTLMPDNITERFMTRHVNGTILRLKNNASESENQRAFPTVVSANSTMYLELEVVSRVTGEQDAHRDVYVQIQMIGCGSKITLMNHTAATVIARLTGGHGVVALYVRGQDSSNCRLSVFEHVTKSSKIIAKGFITPSFNVRTPRKAVHNSTCQTTDCNSVACVAAIPIAGTVRTYNISLQTLLNQIVLIESSYVVRARPYGNVSGITFIGDSEKQVSQGSVLFTVKFGVSANATGLIFEVGRWESIIPLNFTYRVEPYFSRFVRENPKYRRFIRNYAVQTTRTCPFIPKIVATEIRLDPASLRTPTWIPQNERYTIRILATNEYGIQDTDFFGQISVKISNCEQGAYRDLTVASIHPTSALSTTIYSPSTTPRAPATFATSLFDHGHGSVILFPTFNIDSDKNGGVRKCGLTITCPGLTTLYIDPLPEIRKVYPNCEICKPGYWSSGGDGVNVTTTYHHPGGCMPCPLGTFAAFSGGTSELVCSACQSNYGYYIDWWVDNTPREGVIQCTYFCIYGTGGGQAGGGPCTTFTNIGRTDTYTNLNGAYGRTGRYCSGSGCRAAQSCPATTYYLNCQTLVTQATCEHDDNNKTCTWNLLTGTCDGATFNCVPCPAGTVGKTACTLCSMASVCTPCDPGSYSTVRGLPLSQYTSTYYWNEYSCSGASYPWRNTRCFGPGVFECPAGTYSTTYGARDASVCLPCPSGSYCPQIPGRQSSGCPAACVTRRNTCATGCYQCPYTMTFMLGNFMPIPCPAGTYYNKTGASTRGQCRICPAGTSCVQGSAFPQWVDVFNTQNSDGQVTPRGLTFYGSNDVTLCGVAELTDNAQGYVKDGRMSLWKQAFTNNVGGAFSPQVNYQEAWGGKGWWYDPVDRSSVSSSGSIIMNATGAIATQRLQLDHETALESVARVWVQFNLYEKNLSAVRPLPPKPFCGLTLGIHYTNGTETDSYNYTHYAKMFSGTPQLMPNSTRIISAWYLIEILVQPLRPIKWVDFSMLVQGYYFGTARFDDASFKPSHRRICNCSTGFYFNQSERSSRVCRRCPPGFACSGGTMIRCVNSWSAVSFAGCQYCYDGWECDADGRGRQIPCARYNKHDGSTETCSPCPLGYACRDGIQTQCDNGFYGDGGNDCIPCQPGYYSLPGAPRVQCERCYPGTTSVAARWYCTPCEENQYSYKGLECRRCPDGMYAPTENATQCYSCQDAILQGINTTVSRNAREVAIRVVPRYCEPWFKFETERVVNTLNGNLAIALPSNETPSVLYRAGPVLGQHQFTAYVTSNYLASEQSIPVAVDIVNTEPIAQDDLITLSHPKVNTTFQLTTLLFNDYDEDLDDIFFASAYLAPGLPTYNATNVVIAADRKSISVDLPAGYIGPTYINYTVMDQFYAANTSCIAPSCKFSRVASVMFYAVDAFPVATVDTFTFPVGRVYPIDVLANDYDIDGDEIIITNTTAGTLSGIYPVAQRTCPSCPGSCVGLSSCTCAYSTSRGKCFPSNGREYFLDYTASTIVCGVDTFTYSIATRDGKATTSVSVGNTRCYCYTKAVGFNVIFVLDGTQSTSDFGFQLSLADGVMRRSQEGVMFYYGIVEVGANRMLANLSNTFFSIDHLSRSKEGDRTLYTLGKGLQLAKQMITLFGGTRPTYVISVASKNSYDTPSPGAVAANLMTISVSPQLQQVPMFVDYFKSSSYNGVAPTFKDLTQNSGIIPENIMDFMCSH